MNNKEIQEHLKANLEEMMDTAFTEASVDSAKLMSSLEIMMASKQIKTAVDTGNITETEMVADMQLLAEGILNGEIRAKSGEAEENGAKQLFRRGYEVIMMVAKDTSPVIIMN